MNFNDLPDEALLRAEQFLMPNGPVPYRRTAWDDAVRAGNAPAPVIRRHRFVVWRWSDIKVYLRQLGAGEVAP